MLTKCANPACSTPFLYYRDGKLFQFELERTVTGAVARVPRVELFWLCGRCAQSMALKMDGDRAGVIAVPLPQSRAS